MVGKCATCWSCILNYKFALLKELEQSNGRMWYCCGSQIRVFNPMIVFLIGKSRNFLGTNLRWIIFFHRHPLGLTIHTCLDPTTTVTVHNGEQTNDWIPKPHYLTFKEKTNSSRNDSWLRECTVSDGSEATERLTITNGRFSFR